MPWSRSSLYPIRSSTAASSAWGGVVACALDHRRAASSRNCSAMPSARCFACRTASSSSFVPHVLLTLMCVVPVARNSAATPARKNFFIKPAGALLRSSNVSRSRSRLPSVLPPAFKPCRGQLGVTDRVLDVLVPEVCLQRARVPTGVCLVETAGVSEHVWVHLDFEPSGLASPVDELLE